MEELIGRASLPPRVPPCWISIFHRRPPVAPGSDGESGARVRRGMRASPRLHRTPITSSALRGALHDAPPPGARAVNDSSGAAHPLPVKVDLADPRLYVNRELSMLEFQRRVLSLAVDPEIPILERLRFLTICSSNLDEFFEIREAGVREQLMQGMARTGPDGLTPSELLRRIGSVAHYLVAEQYRVLNEVLLPALAKEGIRILRAGDWSAKQKEWARQYFVKEVLPVLTPVGLDPAH